MPVPAGEDWVPWPYNLRKTPSTIPNQIQSNPGCTSPPEYLTTTLISGYGELLKQVHETLVYITGQLVQPLEKEIEMELGFPRNTWSSSNWLRLILEHYDPTKPPSLPTDASPYRIGTVLSHVLEDSLEKPVAYASRMLMKKYSQLDKEAFAIIFGVKRLNYYLYRRSFAIVLDNKSL